MPPETNIVAVKVIYPSARKPAGKDFALNEPVSAVKQFALESFGLKEGADPDNTANQIVYFLYHDRDKVDVLTRPLSEFRHGDQREMTFRFVREVIVG